MKTLEQLAREAGMDYEPHGDEWIDGDRFGSDGVSLQNLSRFRTACRAEALEEAAQRCETEAIDCRKKANPLQYDNADWMADGARLCAAAIREMK